MTKDEALRLALEALEKISMGGDPRWADQAITAIKAALEAKDEPHGWKLVPIEPTDEMLKAMDECSTEGYDERLYAGHAASVYMAAVDVAPIPPKQESKDEPKCVAIVEVFGKDWRLDYMALPVGKHKLYAQQYTYTTPPQRTWVGLMRGVRVEGNAVVITVKGGNDEARALCGELINEMEKNT